MSRYLAGVLLLLVICPLVVSQPLSQKEACQKFAGAVVRIDTGRESRGTGFFITEDGWILTAAHVVIDVTSGQPDTAIMVTLPNGSAALAKQVIPVDENIIGKDFALLRLEQTYSKVPVLDLGDESELVNGSDLTIIGFPFSAVGRIGQPITKKFCLSAAVAGTDVEKIPVRAGTAIRNVEVSVVYLQGPSVKGLSGSPIISRESGQVVGILSTRLTGINRSLQEQRDRLQHPTIDLVGGFSLVQVLRDLVDVLDAQLANGLGSATGIADAKFAFRRARREAEHKRQH